MMIAAQNLDVLEFFTDVKTAIWALTETLLYSNIAHVLVKQR